MPWNWKPLIPLWVKGNHGTLHSWKQYNTHTHIYRPHFTIYITHHFTCKTIFLKALLLMQREQLCDCIHYLSKHIIMKSLVKMVDSILHHHKWISKMRFTCHFRHHDTSLCIFLRNLWHITWRMLSMTSCFSPYTPLILDANIKCSLVGQLLIVLWGKLYHWTLFKPQYTFHPSLYVTHTVGYKSSSMATCSSLYTPSSST
jgi:hypothetical protein